MSSFNAGRAYQKLSDLLESDVFKFVGSKHDYQQFKEKRDLEKAHMILRQLFIELYDILELLNRENHCDLWPPRSIPV